MDINVSTIIGTEAKVSSWRPAGITWSEWSRERQHRRRTLLQTHRMRHPGIAQKRDHGLVVLQTVSCSIGWTVYDVEDVIERIGDEAIAENLNNAVMNRADKKLPSSAEPEFVGTMLCQTSTQKSVRKADTNRTEQDSTYILGVHQLRNREN